MRNGWILILCAGSVFTFSNSKASAQGLPSGRPFQIVTSNLPSAEIGVEYKAEIRGVGGKPQYRWTVLQQSLPARLALHSTRGVISGTPQSAKQFAALLQVSDSSQPP